MLVDLDLGDDTVGQEVVIGPVEAAVVAGASVGAVKGALAVDCRRSTAMSVSICLT